MFLPQQQQRPQPMFFGQDPNMQAQIAQPQQMPQPPQAVAPQGNPLLEALKARQMADSMQGGMNSIQATDPLSALGKSLAGGLEGYAGSKATELETQNQQAADKEITDALSSDDPLKALSRSQSPEGRAAYRQLRLEEVNREKFNPVDVNGDGSPDFYESSKSGKREAAPMSAADKEAQQIRMFQATTGAEGARDRAAAAERARIAAGARAAAPLPQRVQTAEDDDISAIQGTQSINTQLDAVKNQITSGDLELGPVNNFAGGIYNAIGMSTSNSRNLASFQSTLEKIRNDSLRLNKGVQTEGDAVRAWNEVTKSINDPQVVMQQLDRIKTLNDVAAKQRAQMINVRRQRNGAEPFDFSQIAQPETTMPKSDAEPSMEDLEYTAKQNGITVDEVKRRLGVK